MPWHKADKVSTSDSRAVASSMRAEGAMLKDIASKFGISISHAHRISGGHSGQG
jgi:transposase